MLRKFDNHGFTIAELLAIIGAIALLMIIFFPAFSRHLEKSRENVDITNARTIQTILTDAVKAGNVDLTSGEGGRGGIYVIVFKGRDELPRGYGNIPGKGNALVLADPGVTIDGKTSAGGLRQNKELKKLLKFHSVDTDKIQVKSRWEKDGSMGWDWYCAAFVYDQKTGYRTAVYSGFGGQSGAFPETGSKVNRTDNMGEKFKESKMK